MIFAQIAVEIPNLSGASQLVLVSAVERECGDEFARTTPDRISAADRAPHVETPLGRFMNRRAACPAY
ncbi:MAG: hypothetical protein SFV23_02060, partial [Planctomycetaceae bacterium]|nr:hypothetical protein [Planctomycetaceae bacterium]